MLPDGWKYANLGEIINHRKGHPFKSNTYKNYGTRVIRISDTTSNSIHSLNPVFIENNGDENLDDFTLKHGDIILTTVGSKPHLIDSMVGKAVRIPEEIDGALLNQNLVKISPNDKFIISDILFLYLKNQNFITYISDLVRGNANQVSISLKDIFAYSVLLPPLPEQKKIAAILSTWDRAIEGTEKLLANSQQQKKALMQQLLTGKKRLPGFTGEWKNVFLENIALIKKGRALSRKDLIHGDYPVIAGGKTSPYTHKHFTHENVITVSASGAYAGYVSFHSYKIWASDCSVITSRSGNNISFIYFWLSSLQNKIFSLQSGGAQPHIYPHDLELLHIRCPPVPEQKAIAAVLTAADEEITALESDLSRLRQEKKALMQQLLTGKRRVTVD
ncbi:restriction endonuclease subunit S [Acetobacter persici]|uniref:restriction endonuclease subunit S n=1 Tax=Acetobacter persici TaxID=1076596 RepID=UPI0036D8F372